MRRKIIALIVGITACAAFAGLKFLPGSNDGEVLLATGLSAAGIPSASADSLDEQFANPPDSAKPQTWWHWMNGNITKDGITADLEAMARVGIGGAQILDVRSATPGPIRYNSPEWRDMVKHAAQEADRLGLELAIHNCGGYTSSGGPWNTPEQGMQVVVTSEKKVQGPAAFNEVLPTPPIKLNTYRDIAVLAFRTPDGDGMRVQDFSPKVTTSVPQADGGTLLDGKVDTSVVFPVPTPAAPQFIQLEFDQPYRARQLTLTPGNGYYMYKCHGQLEISDDGQTFRTAATFVMPESNEKQTITFDPVSARFYRVLFTEVSIWMKELGIGEVGLTAQPGIENFSGKAFFNRGGNYRSGSGAVPAPDEMVLRTSMVDLTGRLDADGRLNWNVPAGDWSILRVGYTPNGRKNHPSPAEGIGLECDKLSREAVEAHWAGMMGPLIKELGPLAGKTLNNVFIDSYEVGSQNWTPQFRAEFQKRRGYDLIPFLPVLTGRVVDSPEMAERFLWDFRRTIADLFAENYSGTFAELAHKNGLLYSVEPYGICPSDDMQYGSYADIPMAEFWVGGGNERCKLAASIAHVYDRKFVSAEAFTAAPDQGKWLKDPFALKATGDVAWCLGINRFVFHRYAHQPWTQPARKPGMTMIRWGTHFERTLTWWEQSRAWLQYIARSQYLLQQGLFVADVCFFAGDGAPNTLTAGPLPPGYDYDGCSADALKLMSVKDGRIMLPSGMSYGMLVLPPDTTMTLPTIRKIKELADAGALVIGPKPVRSPGLSGYPGCDEEVRKLADAAKIISDKSTAEVLADRNIQPDFEYSASGAKLSFIHRKAGDADIYFVSSQSGQGVAVECTFRVNGKTPELWHPDTGLIEDAPVWREEGGRTIVPLTFDPDGSIFVVFRKPAEDHIVSSQFSVTCPITQTTSAELTILKAEYGAFASSQTMDVTVKIAEQIKNGRLTVTVGNELAGRDPAPMIAKELVVTYRHLDVEKTVRVAEKKTLELPEGEASVAAQPTFELTLGADGQLGFRAWQPGRVEAKTAAGKTLRADVRDVPQPIEVSGPWKLDFPPNWGAPASVSLPKLISWTEHADNGVKYFSGTATYVKEVDIPTEWFGTGRSLCLDLGLVKNIAEVSVNGESLGILWKPPFRVDITGAAKLGKNKLEIKITNLWPNRLIGDEQLPPDCEWRGQALKAWPQWLLDGKPSPTGRLTFTTWRHWTKDDALLPSGLLGPVSILSGVTVPVSN